MKPLSTQQQTLTLLPIIAVIVLTIVFYSLANNNAYQIRVELPKIQGVTLEKAQQLTNIQLTDHQGKSVNLDYFIGKWHFIAYGYTQCPDICPTTLFTLVQLADLLNTNNENINTQFVFYTVDPARDSQQILAQYIHYFSKKFTAMRAETSQYAEIFQQSLGIKVEITRANINNNNEDTNKVELTNSSQNDEVTYQVNHGLTILLINPKSELQAVFFPEITELGIKGFTRDALYHDFLQVFNYYKQRNLL